MNLISIKAECHSGYKANEYPKRFYRNNRRFEIEEIKDRWYQGGRDPAAPVADYFKVNTRCGKQYIIKHDIEPDEWYLVNAGS